MIGPCIELKCPAPLSMGTANKVILPLLASSHTVRKVHVNFCSMKVKRKLRILVRLLLRTFPFFKHVSSGVVNRMAFSLGKIAIL